MNYSGDLNSFRKCSQLGGDTESTVGGGRLGIETTERLGQQLRSDWKRVWRRRMRLRRKARSSWTRRWRRPRTVGVDSLKTGC